MFILKTAIRYAYSRFNGQRTSSIMILFSIAVGLVALIVSVGIMNGLQTDQIMNLRNAESSDIYIEKTSLTISEIEKLTSGRVYPFVETPVLLENENSSQTISLRLRALPLSYFNDERVKNTIFTSSTPDEGLYLSTKTLNDILIQPGRPVNLTLLKKGRSATLIPKKIQTYITCFYSSPLYEFNGNTVYMSLDELKNISNDFEQSYLVFTNENAKQAVEKIKQNDSSSIAYTWQEYNKAIFSALMLEKVLLYVFLTFIFIIICFGLKNSTSRLVKLKTREGAILKAMGLDNKKLSLIFILQSFAVVIPGCIIGCITGYLFVENIQIILSAIGFVSEILTGKTSYLALYGFNASITFSEISLMLFFIIFMAFVFIIGQCKKNWNLSVLEVLQKCM